MFVTTKTRTLKKRSFWTFINTFSPVSAHRLRDRRNRVVHQNDLLLNPNKTAAIITETRQQLAKFDQSDGIIVSGSFEATRTRGNHWEWTRPPRHRLCLGMQLSNSGISPYSPTLRSRHDEHNCVLDRLLETRLLQCHPIRHHGPQLEPPAAGTELPCPCC